MPKFETLLIIMSYFIRIELPEGKNYYDQIKTVTASLNGLVQLDLLGIPRNFLKDIFTKDTSSNHKDMYICT